MTPFQSTPDPTPTRRRTIIVVAVLAAAAVVALALGSGALGDFFAGFNDGLHPPQTSAKVPAR